MTDHTPPTNQQLDEYAAIAARAADDPFYVSDCEGSLQVWREKALTHVRRDANGEIEMYSFPSTYKVTDQIVEIDLDSWDPDEDPADDQRRQDLNDLVDARAAVGVLLAEVRRLHNHVAELETYALGCDAEGCTTPHSSWCERAKTAAAENDGCTCPQPWKDSPQPHAGYCWLISPPRDEIEQARKRIAELGAEHTKLVRWHREDETALAEMRATIARLRARQLTDSEYNAAWHAVEGAAGEDGADPGTVLHAVLDRLRIGWQDTATGDGDRALREFLAGDPKDAYVGHVVGYASDTPECVDDCPGCEQSQTSEEVAR